MNSNACLVIQTIMVKGVTVLLLEMLLALLNLAFIHFCENSFQLPVKLQCLSYGFHSNAKLLLNDAFADGDAACDIAPDPHKNGMCSAMKWFLWPGHSYVRMLFLTFSSIRKSLFLAKFFFLFKDYVPFLLSKFPINTRTTVESLEEKAYSSIHVIPRRKYIVRPK